MKVIQPKLKLQTKLLYILPALAVAIMLFLATSVYLKTTVSPTHAEADRITGSGGATITAAADRDLTVTIHNSEIVLDLTPSQQGVFRYNDFATNPLTVEVATNNPTGYNLNMTATTTDLIRTAPLSGQTPVIHTLSSGSFTADTFETNAWGFTMDGTTYQPVTLSRQINQTIKESNSSTTSLAFGVKLNDEIPSGNYKATLTFIATTNPLEANFDTAFDAAGKTQVSYNGQNYYKMQDMSGFICSMVATPTDATALTTQSTQLIDTRDNSVYWVSKLLDGNCWMTQNLDLNLDSSVALTSADTDLHSVDSWTPTRSTIDSTAYNNTTSGASGGILTFNNGAQNSNFAPDWGLDSDIPLSVDPGYRYVLPKNMTSANTNWYDNGDTFYYCANQDTTCGGNSENGHYTMGNFYNFAAASATNNVETTLGGSANVVQNKVMPDSICPKGWRLPIDQTTNNEFNTLLGASNYNVTSNFNFAGLNAIRTAPLYFVRSGFVSGGTLHDAGVRSLASWSSTISPSTGGYHLRFDSTDIYPAFYSDRLFSFPVRCLARTDLTIEDATYLQDVTPEMRQNTAIGTTATLKDKRDNEEYTIGKLADGNIWLLDNLRLNLVTANLTADDTNAPADAISLLKNGGTTSVAGYTTTAVSYVSSINSSQLGSPSISTEFINDSDGNDRKYGVYYNFCATSAGTYCYGEVDAGGGKYDICPAGWRLPTMKTDNDESKNLYDLYSNYNEWFNALRLPYSGFVDYNGEQGLNGQLGYFVSPDLSRENLEMTTNKTKYGQNYVSFLNGDGSRIILYSVRCLLK